MVETFEGDIVARTVEVGAVRKGNRRCRVGNPKEIDQQKEASDLILNVAFHHSHHSRRRPPRHTIFIARDVGIAGLTEAETEVGGDILLKLTNYQIGREIRQLALSRSACSSARTFVDDS